VLAIALATCLAATVALPAIAAPTSAQTASDRAAVAAAVDELEAAQAKSAELSTQVQEASAELDRVLAEQQAARERLSSRSVMMYRTGETSYVWVLLGAENFQDFAARWDLLMRMNRQDAEDLETLEAARREAAETAESLMALQAQQAEAVDAQKATVAQARQELASSEAALAAYEAQVAAQAAQADGSSSGDAPAASSAPAPDSNQQRTGSGAWKTAVASHYGRNFTGKGASGKSIGPYSMMVAHKTLPFGTLIEFSYGGKRAVASVEDRGPHVAGREFDLGPGVVRALNFSGVDEVKYRLID
jgi:rare lipoprotein A (peptidoglycan hydrolase)